MWLMQNALAKPDNAGAASYDYMHLFGRVALGYMWARIAEAGSRGRKRSFLRRGHGGQLTIGKFYVERMLPDELAPRAHCFRLLHSHVA